MLKWLIISIIFLVTISLVSASALDMCQDTIRISTNCTMLTPSLTCSVPSYDIYNLSGGVVENNNLTILTGDIYYLNFTLGAGSYIVKLCDETTREVIVEAEDDDMTSLAVVIFILFITIGVFILPRFFGQRISQNPILNTTLVGLCYVMALYLLALDTAMVVTIADLYGLGINRELFRLLWLINWSSYIGMVLVVLLFLNRVLGLWGERNKAKRLGLL